jgi:hypothetical protein
MRTGFKREVLELYAEETQDEVVQENFDRIRRVLEKSFFFNFDGDGYTFDFTGDQTNFRFPHNLGFQPKDAWLTSEIGTGVLQFNYDLFDTEELDITVSGVSGTYSVRFVAGILAGDL